MRRAAASLLLALVAACSGVPGEGSVTRIRPVVEPGDLDSSGEQLVRRFFDVAAPATGATPQQIVVGFLDAHVDESEDHDIARLFLADPPLWQDDGVTVFTGERTVTVTPRGDTMEATVTATVSAVVTPRGDYEPRRGTYREKMSLRRVRGEWRLTEVPRGLLLSETRFRSRYARQPLYFPDARRGLLVPEPVFVPQVSNPAAPVLAALLGGPSRWLTPAVSSAIPSGTRLVSPLVVVNGIADVNLSREVDTASSEARTVLVAQIAWTLTEGGLGVRGVRLRVEGRPFTLPGIAPDRLHDQDLWRAYGPEPRPDDERLFFLRDGSLYALDDVAPAVLVRPSVPGIARFAVSPHGSRLAGTIPMPNGREALVTGPLVDGDMRTMVEADALTDPTWSADGTSVWTVRTTAGVSEILAAPATSGALSVVRADLGGPVSALQLSPEGSRVALVRGAGTGRQLLVGRLETVAAGLAVTGLRVVTPLLTDVSTVRWDDATRLQVVARLGNGSPSLYRVEVDGYDLTGDPIEDLPGVPDSVATAPGRVTFVEVRGTLYRRANQGVWAELDEGSAPTYAG